MSNENPNKEQILKAIQKLKNNPNDKLGILADIGIGAVGAIGGGAAAAFLGAGAVPILFGLISIPVAAPLGVVAGGIGLGAAALVGVKRILDGSFTQGKQAEMLRQLEEQLKEVKAKERASKLGDTDKTKFILSLEEPVRLNLISPKDAQDLIKYVELGQITLKNAIEMVENIIKSAKT
ncbi:MAG: hypothetical protein EA343_12100 [Nodularia sp. (in: Bacteria)]|nr:MAG: hypothetical protein EA343_12100 [Nodularia sp. (in: cyanobacteria)]